MIERERRAARSQRLETCDEARQHLDLAQHRAHLGAGKVLAVDAHALAHGRHDDLMVVRCVPRDGCGATRKRARVRYDTIAISLSARAYVPNPEVCASAAAAAAAVAASLAAATTDFWLRSKTSEVERMRTARLIRYGGGARSVRRWIRSRSARASAS